MRNVGSEEIVPHLTSFTYWAEHRKHVTNRAQKLTPYLSISQRPLIHPLGEVQFGNAWTGRDDDPRERLCGNTAFFRVARDVREGCVLEPKLFIIVLEYCFRLTGPEGTGV